MTVDRLDAMALLIAVVEAGSLSAASRQLKIPLPTVSRKIADLERQVNARLLLRTTRRLTLTEVGVTYLAACKRILEQVSDAESQAAGEHQAPKGELSVTAPIVLGRLHVLPVVSDFLEAYSEVSVRMILADRNIRFSDEHIDVAVRVGELPNSSLIATRIGSVRRVVCASPHYFAIHGVPKTPADLGAHSCVTFSGMSTGDSWTFAARDAAAMRVGPRCRLQVNTAEAAIDAAIRGVGLTHVLSYQVAQAIAEGTLRVALKSYEPAPLPVSLMHVGEGPLPLKLRRFLDFAVPPLRKRLLGQIK